MVAIIAGGSPSVHADHTHAATGNPASFGTVAFENSCASAVQTEFRTAIAKLHSFAAAAKDFAEVARKDPSCAIAWWGAAMAARGNPLVGELDRDGLKTGRDFLGRTATLKTTPRERAYIDALLIYYQEYPNGGQVARTRAYEAAMERVFAAYPDEPRRRHFTASPLSSPSISMSAITTSS